MAARFAEGQVTAAQMDVVAGAVGERERAQPAEQGVDLGPFDQTWATIATEGGA